MSEAAALGSKGAVSKWAWNMLLADHEIPTLTFMLTNRLGNSENRKQRHIKRISKAKMNYCFSAKNIARLMKKEERKVEGFVKRERGLPLEI